MTNNINVQQFTKDQSKQSIYKISIDLAANLHKGYLELLENSFSSSLELLFDNTVGCF